MGEGLRGESEDENQQLVLREVKAEERGAGVPPEEPDRGHPPTSLLITHLRAPSAAMAPNLLFAPESSVLILVLGEAPGTSTKRSHGPSCPLPPSLLLPTPLRSQEQRQVPVLSADSAGSPALKDLLLRCGQNPSWNHLMPLDLWKVQVLSQNPG